jgi:protein MpaA
LKKCGTGWVWTTDPVSTGSDKSSSWLQAGELPQHRQAMNGWKKSLAGVAILLAGCAAPMHQSNAAQSHKVPVHAADPQPQLGPSRGPTTPSNTPAATPAPKKPVLDGPLLGYPQAKSEKPPTRVPDWPSSPQAAGPSTGARSSATHDPFTNVSRSSLLDEPRWERLHRSTDRRPIETAQIGVGRERIVVLSSLHGDETQSIALVDHLARHITGHASDFHAVTVLFIRTPNPDGLASKNPYNARGVDLNRNFPALNWKSNPAKHTGEKPGSEVETRVIARLLTDFRPTRLVHVKDSPSGGFVNHDGGLRDLALEVGRRSSLKVVKDLGQATTGSIESFAVTELHAPSLTLLLPRERNDQTAWEKSKAALLASILGSRDPFEPDPDADRTRRTAPGGSSKETSWRPRSNTAAPRSIAETTSTVFPVPVPERGYLELPPPPSRNAR